MEVELWAAVNEEAADAARGDLGGGWDCGAPAAGGAGAAGAASSSSPSAGGGSSKPCSSGSAAGGSEAAGAAAGAGGGAGHGEEAAAVVHVRLPLPFRLRAPPFSPPRPQGAPMDPDAPFADKPRACPVPLGDLAARVARALRGALPPLAAAGLLPPGAEEAVCEAAELLLEVAVEGCLLEAELPGLVDMLLATRALLAAARGEEPAAKRPRRDAAAPRPPQLGAIETIDLT